jgi:tight adherence protein B
MDNNQILTLGLALVAIAAVVYVAYPYLSGDIKAERRRSAIEATAVKRIERVTDSGNRRKQITESLKELEQRGKKKSRVTIENKLGQAGLDWTPRAFYIFSAVMGLIFGGIVFVATSNPIIALPAAVVGALGIPNWFLAFRRKRRIAKFLNEFPNAVDVIVRGIRSGLPLGDCLRVIASESAEPVKSEFRHIVESQSIGLSMSEAVERIVDRVPIPEANFFAIVISIQQKAGGNLSEALANLSRVLRDRKKMKAKVKAVASEANASAMIIGSMPFIVGFLIYLTSPKYLELLWTTTTGRMMLVVAAVWMSIGIAVMRKMISFEV